MRRTVILRRTGCSSDSGRTGTDASRERAFRSRPHGKRIADPDDDPPIGPSCFLPRRHGQTPFSDSPAAHNLQTVFSATSLGPFTGGFRPPAENRTFQHPRPSPLFRDKRTSNAVGTDRPSKRPSPSAAATRKVPPHGSRCKRLLTTVPYGLASETQYSEKTTRFRQGIPKGPLVSGKETRNRRIYEIRFRPSLSSLLKAVFESYGCIAAATDKAPDFRRFSPGRRSFPPGAPFRFRMRRSPGRPARQNGLSPFTGPAAHRPAPPPPHRAERNPASGTDKIRESSSPRKIHFPKKPCIPYPPRGSAYK